MLFGPGILAGHDPQTFYRPHKAHQQDRLALIPGTARDAVGVDSV